MKKIIFLLIVFISINFIFSPAFSADNKNLQFKKQPEIQQVKPKKPVKIKLKRLAEGKYTSHYGISNLLISYWGEKEKVKSAEIIEKLQSGQSVALISDAGSPGISDPGAVLIKKAIEENIQIVSIPGPSALIAALSLSGLHTEEFIFIGFLPSKKSQRQKILRDLSLEPRTLVFYEAPHRILETLQDMEKIFMERRD